MGVGLVVRSQRYDLLSALKGKIEKEIAYYNRPEVSGTSSQSSRVIGRIEGYEHILKVIEELLNTDTLVLSPSTSTSISIS